MSFSATFAFRIAKNAKRVKRKTDSHFAVVCHARLGRILCWSPSRALLTMSGHLHLLLLLFLLLRSEGASAPFGEHPDDKALPDGRGCDVRSEDPDFRERDKNPRRSRGKIATPLHRAGYTHDETPRDGNNEGERAEKGWEGRERGDGDGGEK